MKEYLEETYYYNFSHPQIQEFVNNINPQLSSKEQAIALYLKVRDGWRYDPYTFHTNKEHFQASAILQRPNGHCLDKSILLLTCYRAIGLPSRIHLAKVRNHIGVDRIVEKFGTDELAPHGFVEVYLNDKWIACTPAFNKALCEKLKVEVLEFDGEKDSIFQSYNTEGQQFMEYLEDYGTFVDYPYDYALQVLIKQYPGFEKLKTVSPVFNLNA